MVNQFSPSVDCFGTESLPASLECFKSKNKNQIRFASAADSLDGGSIQHIISFYRAPKGSRLFDRTQALFLQPMENFSA